MPMHFAAARSAARSPVARALARKALRRAANDNPGGAAGEAASDPILHAALRHFGEHGLRAADTAAAMAERAWRRGEIDTSRWWVEICRKLDRRRAARLEKAMRSQDVG